MNLPVTRHETDRAHLKGEVSPNTVCDVLEGYLRWAMRIEKPELDPSFAAMKQFLSGLAAVRNRAAVGVYRPRS